MAKRDTNKYVKDGVVLDLTYILPNIIATRIPSGKLRSAVDGNDIDQISRFLDETHGDHYYVYNLCNKYSYDVSKFHGRVTRYPIHDYCPPLITMMHTFCEDVDRWLSQNPKNVVVVHCHAGKGRTGTMVSSYLLFKRFFNCAEKAIAFYRSKRIKPDGTAMTRPSQARYVRYFERLIRERFVYRPNVLQLLAIEFTSPLETDGPWLCFSVGQSETKNVYESDEYPGPSSSDNEFIMRLDEPLQISGDVKVTFFDKFPIIGKKKLFWVYFNTHFVSNTFERCYGVQGQSGDPGHPATMLNGSSRFSNWQPVSANPPRVMDGSRQGASCLVSVINVGSWMPPPIVSPSGLRSSAAVSNPGKCITALFPRSELDTRKTILMSRMAKPDFAVKFHLAAIPGVTGVV